jgi:MerR family transcriptional regulator, light-induced transcriptional regulator
VTGRTSVVVGLPPGSRHELGALAFAVALRRRGVGVLYLGPDVPIDAWIDVLRQTRARAAVVGVVTDADRASAAGVVTALRAEGIQVVAIGGAAASLDVAPANGVLVLPERVVEAAAAAEGAVGRRRRVVSSG